MAHLKPESSPVSIHSSFKQVKDFRLHYTLISIDTEEAFLNVFPRVGHLVCNLAIGENLECKYLNYSGERVLPNRLFISGLLSKGSLLCSLKNQGNGYAFKVHPVIGHHLLKIPMTEIVDRMVSVSDTLQIHGRKLRELEDNEQIDSFHNQRFQQFLWEAIPEKRTLLDDPIFHAVNTIIKHRGNVRIPELASEFHMSQRTLRRHFLRKVGLSPQAYARIWKMHNAINCIRKNPHLSLEEVAWKSGYYDVSHLAHDFNNRVQIAPSQLPQKLNPLLHRYLDSLTIG